MEREGPEGSGRCGPDRRDLRWALGLLGLALLPRLLHLLLVRDSPFFSILYIDPLMYDEWGMRIAEGQLLSEQPFFLDPLYPYFLGAIYAVFGHRYEAVVAVQSLLGALVAPLIFLAALRWLDRSVAVTAGVIAAVYVPGIYFGSLIMKPGLALFLVALLLWMLSRALDEPPAGLGWWIAGGVVLGLACLTRGNLLLVVPVVAAWLWLRGVPREGEQPPIARRLKDRRRLLETGALLGGTAAVLALPFAHNYAVGGELILTTANAGANFYIGNNPTNDSGEYQQLRFIRANPKYEQEDFHREAERRSGRELNDRQTSAFWFRESAGWIREEPWAWLRLLGRKARSFWGAYEIPDSVDYYLYREYAPVLRVPIPGFGLLAPLGLLGLLLAVPRRGWPRLLLVLVLAYFLTIVFFFVFSRFRMVVAPALYVFAALAVVELVRRWRRSRENTRQLRTAVTTTLLFVACFLFVNLPLRARTDTLGYRIADAIGWPTRPETSAQGHYNLGVAYAALAKRENEPARLLQLAEREIRHAIELWGETDSALPRVELGKVLARQGRNLEALAVYHEAVAIEPLDYQIHHALGILYKREQQLEQAAAAFRRALELAPRHVASATRLGDVLLQLGRKQEAAQAFSHALRLRPDHREAQDGLRAATEP